MRADRHGGRLRLGLVCQRRRGHRFPRRQLEPPAAHHRVGSAPSAIAVGLNSVWVATGEDGTVTLIDPATNQTQTIAVGADPGGLVVTGGSVWVTNTAPATASRIAPAANAVAQAIQAGASPSGIAAGRDVWVVNSADGTVSKIIGGRTLAVSPPDPSWQLPEGVAVIGDSVWITNNLDGTVARISTTGTSVADTVRVGAQPTQIAAVDGHVWVATQADDRIAGSIRQPPSSSVQCHWERYPAASSPPQDGSGSRHRSIPHCTVAARSPRGQRFRGTGHRPDRSALCQRRRDGVPVQRHLRRAGRVPACGRRRRHHARARPRDRDSGPDQCRPHVRVPAAQRHSLVNRSPRGGLRRAPRYRTGDRLWIQSAGQQVVGASGCRPSRCDVSGIAVHPLPPVTITLVRPDGNFLDDLTGAPAAPAATPRGQQKTHPIPATGPYQISRYLPSRLVELTRNRLFASGRPRLSRPAPRTGSNWQFDPAGNAKRAVGVATARADWANARTAAPSARSRLASAPGCTERRP